MLVLPLGGSLDFDTGIFFPLVLQIRVIQNLRKIIVRTSRRYKGKAHQKILHQHHLPKLF